MGATESRERESENKKREKERKDAESEDEAPKGKRRKKAAEATAAAPSEGGGKDAAVMTREEFEAAAPKTMVFRMKGTTVSETTESREEEREGETVIAAQMREFATGSIGWAGFKSVVVPIRREGTNIEARVRAHVTINAVVPGTKGHGPITTTTAATTATTPSATAASATAQGDGEEETAHTKKNERKGKGREGRQQQQQRETATKGTPDRTAKDGANGREDTGRLNEALFFRRGATDENRRNSERLIGYLNGATSSIDVCVFSITRGEASKALIEAHRRGIRVRVITDDDTAKEKGSVATELMAEGIPLRTDHTKARMHHKFAVVDGTLVISGSLNWTRSGMTVNNENAVVCDSPSLVSQFAEHFGILWSEFDTSHHPPKPQPTGHSRT